PIPGSGKVFANFSLRGGTNGGSSGSERTGIPAPLALGPSCSFAAAFPSRGFQLSLGYGLLTVPQPCSHCMIYQGYAQETVPQHGGRDPPIRRRGTVAAIHPASGTLQERARNRSVSIMATAPLDTLLHRLHKLAAGPRLAPGTDRQLLDDFTARRDEAAFAAL